MKSSPQWHGGRRVGIEEYRDTQVSRSLTLSCYGLETPPMCASWLGGCIHAAPSGFWGVVEREPLRRGGWSSSWLWIVINWAGRQAVTFVNRSTHASLAPTRPGGSDEECCTYVKRGRSQVTNGSVALKRKIPAASGLFDRMPSANRGKSDNRL